MGDTKALEDSLKACAELKTKLGNIIDPKLNIDDEELERHQKNLFIQRQQYPEDIDQLIALLPKTNLNETLQGLNPAAAVLLLQKIWDITAIVISKTNESNMTATDKYEKIHKLEADLKLLNIDPIEAAAKLEAEAQTLANIKAAEAKMVTIAAAKSKIFSIYDTESNKLLSDSEFAEFRDSLIAQQYQELNKRSISELLQQLPQTNLFEALKDLEPKDYLMKLHKIFTICDLVNQKITQSGGISNNLSEIATLEAKLKVLKLDEFKSDKQQIIFPPKDNREALQRDLETFIQKRETAEGTIKKSGILLLRSSKARTAGRADNVALAKLLLADLKQGGTNFESISKNRLNLGTRILPGKYRAKEIPADQSPTGQKIPAFDIHSNELNRIISEMKRLGNKLDQAPDANKPPKSARRLPTKH